jgi:Lsr2
VRPGGAVPWAGIGFTRERGLVAKRQLVTYSYSCDLCGADIEEKAPRKVSWEGDLYEVDVCGDHDSQLGGILAQLSAFAKAGSSPTRGRAARRRGALAAPRRRSATSAASGDAAAADDAAENAASGPGNRPAVPATGGSDQAAGDSPTRGARRRRPATPKAAAAAGKRGDLAAVRTWARDNGVEVGERGRIPAAVLAAYDAANTMADSPPRRSRKPAG